MTLTATPHAILDFIKEFIAKRGYSPSVREIGAAVGLNSSATVHRHLQKLRVKGYITFEDSKTRTIRVYEKGTGNVSNNHM